MRTPSGSNADILKETFSAWGKIKLDIAGISGSTITILWMSLPTYYKD